MLIIFSKPITVVTQTHRRVPLITLPCIGYTRAWEMIVYC